MCPLVLSRKVEQWSFSQIGFTIITKGFQLAFKDLNPSALPLNPSLRLMSGSSARRFYIVGGKSLYGIVLLESHDSVWGRR